MALQNGLAGLSVATFKAKMKDLLRQSNAVGTTLASGPPCDDSCPEYQVVSRTARYEVRLYPAIIWVSYVTATENRLLAEMEAQAGIEDYLEGDNSRGARLRRGYPTLTQLQFSPGHSSGRQPGGDFSVSVPLLAETDPPRPTTDQVVLDSVDQQRVFVMSFRARPWKLTDRSLRMRTRRFSRRLRRHGQTFLDEYFYLAKYKESSSEHRSYYEIWLYGTPHESTHRFRPMGKRLLDRRSNLTIATMRRLCRGRECPRFEVLGEFPGGIQKRHYYNAAFATSRLDRCESSLSAVWSGLLPLHLYREGINTHLERIEPTRPAGVLRVWREEASNGTSVCHMTVMVYLPRRLHRSPPNTGVHAPTVGLSYIHELTVYVQTAGDLDLGSGHLDRHVTEFHMRLDELGLCYKSDEYFIAVYDDVQRYHGRMNELWTVAQRCPQPQEQDAL
ncbi:Heme-binding protein 2 [Amphibalanus amphitrite]|uniref:Heme-binding protein 2 n=1 Tax=Amphibalanus amphitrite TaxID=1232801 RepID=A0A6A4WZ37_AMPAM|nr:Heme-binding protein 2 [Amphibalanus amphitrite]